MALGLVRYFGEFKSSAGVLYKIEIYDANMTTGLPLEFNCGKDGFKLKYDGEGKEMFHPIKASSLSIEAISMADVLLGIDFDAFIQDIRESEQGRFKVRVLRDGSQFWRGTILADVGSLEDEYYPRRATLRAVCGLSLLKKVDLDKDTWQTTADKEQLRSFLEIILKTIVTYTNTIDWFSATDTYLWTSVDWYEDTMPTPASNIDPLKYSASYINAFVKDTESESQDIMTAYEALEQICKVWGARVFQSNGFWRFVQVGQYSEASVFYRRYGWGSFTALGSGSIDLRKDAGSASSAYDIKDAGGQEDYYPKLKKVRAEYGKLGDGGLYGAEQELDDYTTIAAMESSLIDVGFVNNVADSAINIEHSITGKYTSAAGTYNSNNNGWVKYMLKVGSYYWDGSQWTTTQSTFYVNIGSISIYFNTILQSSHTVSVVTSVPPVSGVLKYYATKFIGSVGNPTQLADDNDYTVTIEKNGDSTSKVYYSVDGEVTDAQVYIAENTTEEANEMIDFGLLVFGDPSQTSGAEWGRIRVSADLITWPQTSDGQWQAKGAGITTSISALMCHEVLAQQNEFIRKPLKHLIVLNGAAFDFLNSLKFGTQVYMIAGYTFTANLDAYQCELAYMAHDLTGIAIDDELIQINANFSATAW